MRIDVAPLEGFHPELGLLLASMHDSTREWRENLGDLPPEAMTWQAREGGHSIGALILHMADCESGWFEGFVAEREISEEQDKLLMTHEVKQDTGEWPVPHAESQDWYFQLHDRIRNQAFDALKDQQPDRWIERKTFAATVRWVAAHVLEHDAYHGGQAVLLADLWRAQNA